MPKIWKAALIAATVAVLPHHTVASEHHKKGDGYIACVAKTAAIALRSNDNHAEAEAAAEKAPDICKSSWPTQLLTETEKSDLMSEAADLVSMLIKTPACDGGD